MGRIRIKGFETKVVRRICGKERERERGG